jgi:hypothetical protein
MCLCESAASRNNSLSQPTHIPAWFTGKGQQSRGLRRVLDSSSRIASRGPIEIKSSQGLMRNPTGYGHNVVHGQSTTMLSNVASPGKRSRVSSKKEGKKMQTRRSILGGQRSLRDSKKRGSRWQWRLHFEASKHEEYGWLKQLMRSKNLWHLRFNIFIQRHNCVQSGFSYLLYHLYTSKNENYPEGVISYEKLAKVKNFGWKFKTSIRGRFQKNCEFQKCLHETHKGKCWNISHGTVLKICPYKPSAMI